MKIAVLSDIHGNVPALEAVLEDLLPWGPDRVIMNGDLVSRGPDSRTCFDRLYQAIPAIQMVEGNHEEYVRTVAGSETKPRDPRWELARFVRWTRTQLGPERLADLARWPDHLDWLDGEGASLHSTHGSRLGNRVGISARTPDRALPARLGDPRDLFIVSHTHKPLLRRFGETLIINSGSVGTPMDGDPRASYARLHWFGGRWHVRIRRIPYDRHRTERDFFESGFMAMGGPFAQIILAEFREARPLAGPWMRRFHEPVLRGELSLEESVARHLEEQGVSGTPL